MLVAIARLSGDSYRDVDGSDLIVELDRQGIAIDRIGLYNLMHRLKSEGFVSWAGGAGMKVDRMALIRLEGRGRREVEGWSRDHDGDVIGDDNTIIGTPPRRMGSRNTIISATDQAGDTIINRGGTAIGHGAQADPTSVAVGSGALAGGPALVPLLREMAAAMLTAGRPEGVNLADDLIAHAEAPETNRAAISRVWNGLKALATTEELVSLVARVEPLIHSLLR